MTHDGSALDWDDVHEAGEKDQLMELLRSLPRARWMQRDAYGRTLFYFAVRGANVAAVVTLIESATVTVGNIPYTVRQMMPTPLPIGTDVRLCLA